MISAITEAFRRLIGGNGSAEKQSVHDRPIPVLLDTLSAQRVDAIIDGYSQLLDTGLADWTASGTLVYPLSLLPAPRPEIEQSLVRLGRTLHLNGQLTQQARENLTYCYQELAHFIPDDLAHRVRAFNLALRERRYEDVAKDDGQSSAILNESLEAAKLRAATFDAMLTVKLGLR